MDGEAPAEVEHVDYRKKRGSNIQIKSATEPKSYCKIHHRRDKSFEASEKNYMADGQDYHS